MSYIKGKGERKKMKKDLFIKTLLKEKDLIERKEWL